MQIIKSIFRECDMETYKVVKNSLRAVIKCNDKYFMFRHREFNDFTFPGVEIERRLGMKDKVEEVFKGIVGAEFFTSIEALGAIEEYRPLKEGVGAFNQVSYYFICEFNDIDESLIEKHRILSVFEPVWVTLDEALQLNEINSKDVSTAKLRDYFMCEYIKREGM